MINKSKIHILFFNLLFSCFSFWFYFFISSYRFWKDVRTCEHRSYSASNDFPSWDETLLFFLFSLLSVPSILEILSKWESRLLFVRSSRFVLSFDKFIFSFIFPYCIGFENTFWKSKSCLFFLRLLTVVFLFEGLEKLDVFRFLWVLGVSLCSEVRKFLLQFLQNNKFYFAQNI